MNKNLLVIGTILAGIGLFIGGLFFGQANVRAIQPGSMMDNWNAQVGSGMMGGSMMGNWNGQAGQGMMDNGMMGMMMNGGIMSVGTMDSFGRLNDVEPLSIEEAETAVINYLATLNDDELTLGEIMIFDNHAYAQIVDESTEMGAFEVLVDHTTGNVFPEPGPNMMWNTEYGMMDGFDGDTMGMMGGNMMGNYGYMSDTEINVTAEDAVNIAQEYLDDSLPGKTADAQADAFPGYYTIHVVEDGETTGMLSVNAYTGQVFLHHWHGDFIEMLDEDHG
jgi:hypothetical protein